MAEVRIYGVAPDLALAKFRIQPPHMAADAIEANERRTFIRPTSVHVQSVSDGSKRLYRARAQPIQEFLARVDL